MSARKKALLYGVASQRKFSQNIAEKILKKKGYVMNEKNSLCLYPHNRKESLKHWITKAVVFKILFDKRRDVGSEIEVGNGITDIFDSDTKIAYEIENNFSRIKSESKWENLTMIADLIVIDLKKVPNEIYAMNKHLEKLVV